MPLGLKYPPDQRLENFVAAPPAALEQLRLLAAGEGAGLYLAGGEGSGKTHLALAICSEAERIGRTSHYLPVAVLGQYLQDALPVPQPGVLYALDGLEKIAGMRAQEVALFNFHNAVRDCGGQLLYTAIQTAEHLELVLPDLASRLAQLPRIVLALADDAARAEILRLRAARRGLQFDDAAIDWLLKHHGRDLHGLAQLFERLDRESLAAQRRLTLPFLRQVLAASNS
ncbi:DnaA regulatory inactivator Hda [Lysobacteraceae bacterium NML95-0200]|nr:DnaA regulatory inactivator Hda [Xanthomonadaceae bacterium NML95-0200]